MSTAKIIQSQGHLSTFAKSGDLDELRQSIESLEGIGPPPMISSNAERREVAAAWLSLLREVDAHSDQGSNVRAVPQLNLMPPASAGGRSYPSGIDPESITDPATRTKYENLVKSNQDLIAKSNYQLRLQKTRQRAEAGLGIHLRERYSRSPEDLAELETLFDAHSVPASSRDKIKESLNE